MSRTRWKIIGCTTAAFGMSVLTGCETYRVEYHKRPAYYQQATEQELPDEVVLADGTRIVYSTQSYVGAWSDDGDATSEGAEPTPLREETEGGDVILRAFMPEHVLMHTLQTLHNQEYDILWDQLVADSTKASYPDAETGKKQFIRWCTRNRRDLVATLTRIQVGLTHHDVVVDNVGPNVMRYRLRTNVASHFRFTHMDIETESFDMKLKMIK